MARRRFTAEFKRSAVALICERNYTRQQTAVSLGINASTLEKIGFKNIAGCLPRPKQVVL